MQKNFDILFGAQINKSPISALVRIAGSNDDLRIRTGTVDTLTPTHVVILDDKRGYRKARLADVLYVQ